MIVVHTVVELRAAVAQARRDGKTVGLVPTMGALHAGHTALLRRARHEHDFVVMSLFVNPAQFDEAADLDAYPRNERPTRCWRARRASTSSSRPTPPRSTRPASRPRSRSAG